MLKEAIATTIRVRPKTLRALRSFQGVYITDSTTLPLPPSLADLFPGCGGGAGNAAPAAMLKILVTYNVQTGTVHQLTLHAGKEGDKGLPWVEGLPAKSLHVADLAFYNQERFVAATAHEQYWISRLAATNTLRGADEPLEAIQKIVPFLESHQNNGVVDQAVIMGAADHAHPLPARLLAWRCSPAEQKERERRLQARAKEEKKSVSPAMLALCCWMVYITNAPVPDVSPKQIGELYRIRWQIELLFKRWKSWLGLAKRSRKKKAATAQVEVYARLLGVVLAEWLGAACGGPLEMPLVPVVKLLKKWCWQWAEVLWWGAGLEALCARFFQRLERYRPRVQEKVTRTKTRNRLHFTVDFA